MKVETLILGVVQTNTYIVINGSEAIIIDPETETLSEQSDLDGGVAGQYILDKCNELQVKPIAILLTHGHFDHIGAVNGLKEKLNLPVYASENEVKFVSDPQYNGSAKLGRTPISVNVDVALRDEEVITLAGLKIKVIATPGHTAGSVCYYIESENTVFTGDTLFLESYGRTDFPGGSQSELTKSIINKLFVLPDETNVYPGHAGSTIIKHERKNNPVLI